MAAAGAIDPLFEQIPDDLKEWDQWVLWRLEDRDGNKTKVPYQTNGKRASSTDPATWNSFDDCVAAFNKGGFSGIGYVFSEDDGYVGIDVDDCLNRNGTVKPWAQPILEKLQGSYAEISPSGAGIKFWIRAKLAKNITNKNYQDGAVEIYVRGRYFTTTCRKLAGAPTSIEEHQQALDWLVELITANGKHKSSQAVRADLQCEEKIPPGSRHKFLVSTAAQLEATGLKKPIVLETLRTFNSKQCTSPKPDRELEDIVNFVFANPATKSRSALAVVPQGEIVEQNGTPNLLRQLFNDHGNAEKLIALYGRMLRYCHPMRKWLVWDGYRWAVDTTDQARKLAKLAMLECLTQALNAGDREAEKWAKSSLDQRRITNMLAMAECEIYVSPDQLDTHPFLLNFKNGTLDLETGHLMAHNPEHFITKLVHFEYSSTATCPTFISFLSRIMGSSPDGSEEENDRSDRLISYLQKAFGYSLTGTTSEKAVFILHGSGNNGKSTLLSTFRHILQEYSSLLQIDTLMARQQETNNTQSDLADLRGARFVMTSETEEGQRLAEGKLKRISQGMGTVKTVRKYENPIEFNETHKLWMDANHKPVIRGTDSAIWSRLHAIPFLVTIPKCEIDPSLPEKLKSEAPGILAWAVEGARRWRQEGLGKPLEIEKAATDWRVESDPLHDFVEEVCTMHPDFYVKSSELWRAYEGWTSANGERLVLDRKKFSDRLQALGCKSTFRRFGNPYADRAWEGIQIKSSVAQQTAYSEDRG